MLLSNVACSFLDQRHFKPYPHADTGTDGAKQHPAMQTLVGAGLLYLHCSSDDGRAEAGV